MASFVKRYFATNTRDCEISEIVPLSDCSHDCDSCSTKLPASFAISDQNMYNSAKKIDLHFVVPTNKSDWQRDATSTSNTVENALCKWADSKAAKTCLPDGNIKVSASSFPTDFTDPKALRGQVNDILILPYFVWVKKIEHTQVSSVMTELIPILIQKRNEGATDVPQKLQGLSIELSPALSYIFLCSHKSRDKKCGITAPLMKKEMEQRLRETGNYRDIGDDRPNGVHVVFVNHVGGHKFAANVIIYLRTGEMIWLAKCSPKNAKPIIDETVLGGGKVWGDLVRRVQKEKSIQW